MQFGNSVVRDKIKYDTSQLHNNTTLLLQPTVLFRASHLLELRSIFRHKAHNLRDHVLDIIFNGTNMLRITHGLNHVILVAILRHT